MVKYELINTAVFNTTRFMLTDVSKNNALNGEHWIFLKPEGWSPSNCLFPFWYFPLCSWNFSFKMRHETSHSLGTEVHLQLCIYSRWINLTNIKFQEFYKETAYVKQFCLIKTHLAYYKITSILNQLVCHSLSFHIVPNITFKLNADCFNNKNIM